MKEYAYIHEEGNLPSPLRDLEILESIPQEHLNDILFSSYFLECDPEDVFIEQGTSDTRMFVLLAGTVRVERDGKPIARSSTAGELFGEIAVFNEENRMASVIADTQVLLLVVDLKFLQEIKPSGVSENASFYAAAYGFLAKAMATRLTRTSRELARVEAELERLKEKQSLT